MSRTALVVAAGIGVFASGIAIGMWKIVLAPAPPERCFGRTVVERVDPCALPQGIDLKALDPADRGRVAFRALLCADYHQQRITLDEYRAYVLEEIDPPPPPAPPPALPILWASSVREVSSQYGDGSWSASRALGPPDVTELGVDDERAWAPETMDDRIETLEVGFEPASSIAGVEIVESYNPGAITSIELVDEGGGRTSVYRGGAKPAGAPFRSVLEFACTEKPIVAVRIQLDSPNVYGWNEIDAIGVRPCPR